MRTAAAVFYVAILIGTAGCNSANRDDQSDAPAKPAAGTSASGRQVTGTVRHVDLEGGFYGIETDEGARLDPVNLPEEFHKDGLRIRAWIEDLPDRVSFRMWGTLVRLRDIERL
jgi:hypothetical protein